MSEYDLNDTVKVRTDAINLVDNLTEYMDSGDDEAANELFRDFIRHLIVNGFIRNNINETTEHARTFGGGLSDESLYDIPPSAFSFRLIKYCFYDVPDIYKHIDLDFPNWKFTMTKLMGAFNLPSDDSKALQSI